MRRTLSSELLSDGVKLHFSTTSLRLTTSTLGQGQEALSLGATIHTPPSRSPHNCMGTVGDFGGLPRPEIFSGT